MYIAEATNAKTHTLYRGWAFQWMLPRTIKLLIKHLVHWHVQPRLMRMDLGTKRSVFHLLNMPHRSAVTARSVFRVVCCKPSLTRCFLGPCGSSLY